MKKSKFIQLFLLSILFVFNIQAKPISYFINKYKLNDNVNILSLYDHDCVNCYLGFSTFIKMNQKGINKDNFVIVINNFPETELNNFFQYTLGLDKNNFHVINDADFYKAVSDVSNSTLAIIEEKKIIKKYKPSELANFAGFAKTASSKLKIDKPDTVNLKSISGTSNIRFIPVDTNTIFTLNNYKGEIQKINLKTKNSVANISIKYFIDRYDSVLKDIFSIDTALCNFNLRRYKTEDIYKTFPLCAFSHLLYVKNSILYVGMSIRIIDIDPQNKHERLETVLAILELSENLKPRKIFVPKEKPENSNKYISHMNTDFLNADTVVFSTSYDGINKGDSVAVVYSLSKNKGRLLPWNYEPFFPRIGANGYPNYYTRSVWMQHDSLYGFFNSYPYVYNIENNKKRTLADVKYDIKKPDENKFFWIYKIFPYNGNYLSVITLKENETYIFLYDDKFSKVLLKQKLNISGYFSGNIYLINNTLMGLYSGEKQDKAILYMYKLK